MSLEIDWEKVSRIIEYLDQQHELATDAEDLSLRYWYYDGAVFYEKLLDLKDTRLMPLNP